MNNDKSLKTQIYEFLKDQKEPLTYSEIKRGMGIHQPIYSEMVDLVLKNKVIKIARGEEFIYRVG